VSTGQIALYIVLGLIGLLMLRRFWRARGIPQHSAAVVAGKIKDRAAIVLIDVRTAGERERQSIRGSIHIPMHELRRRADELEKHRKKELICYCASGSRSLSAAGALRKRGFDAANMKGGMAAWNRQEPQ
jgi:rhodanese-related sulfurtransferase